MKSPLFMCSTIWCFNDGGYGLAENISTFRPNTSKPYAAQSYAYTQAYTLIEIAEFWDKLQVDTAKPSGNYVQEYVIYAARVPPPQQHIAVYIQYDKQT